LRKAAFLESALMEILPSKEITPEALRKDDRDNHG
jgi:hypothetical protein